MTHEHYDHHEHGHSCAAKPRTTRADRLIMLIMVLAASVFLLRPLVAYQSYMRGYSYTETGEASKAVKHLERSILLDDSNYAAWSLLGYNYLKLHREEDAMKALNRAIELNPEDIQAVIELSLIYFNSGDYAQAAELLSRHLQEKTEHTDGWILLATCYEKMNQNEAARAVWKKIYEDIDPGNIVAESKLGD